MRVRTILGRRHTVRVGWLVAVVALTGSLLAGCNPAPDVALWGTVTTTSGATVGQVPVTVYSGPTTQVAQATTNGSGNYEIDDTYLAAGIYRVRVGDQWYGPGATDYVNAEPVTISADHPTRLNLTLTSAAVVTGTVVDANHDPAAGTVLAASDASGNVVGIATTTATGEFDLGVPGGVTITIKLLDQSHSLVTFGGAKPSQVTTTAGATNDIGTLTIVDPIQITTGGYHTCAIQTDHTVACWGYNISGQLGNGSKTDSRAPVAVSNLNDVIAIAAGRYHTCALRSDHTVACWGYNGFGQLGNGTNGDSNVPVPVSGLNDVIAISTGGYDTCALKSDGTVACWGYNLRGQLGNGTNDDSNVPVAVSNLTDATVIAVGGSDTCAVKSDRTVACWGFNGTGQLGNGTSGSSTSSNVPVAVSNLTDATAVTVGAVHTCALKSDGAVACWGLNAWGALGNGTNDDSNVPVAVSNLTDATAITAGDGHTCALKSDGTVACWGYNADGQLGNSAIANSIVPDPVTGLTNATTISSESSHTCALKSDHSVACWGVNVNGQLGNGTTVGSNLPVPVTGLPYARLVTP